MTPPGAFPPIVAIVIALVVYWCLLPLANAPETVDERKRAIEWAASTACLACAIVGFWIGRRFGRAGTGSDDGGAAFFGVQVGIVMGAVIGIGIRGIGKFYYLESTAGDGSASGSE